MASKKDGFGHEKPYEGETNDWITPKWIISAFNKKSNGMFFDLDPCISITQPWATAKHGYNKVQNGLLQDWYGTIYCNPPYGPNVGAWARRMTKHNNGIMLIFARLETAVWFDNIFTHADGYLFLRGRIAFYRPDGTRGDDAGAPSALIAWGDKCRSALMEMCDEGIVDDKLNVRSSVFFGKAFYTGLYSIRNLNKVDGND